MKLLLENWRKHINEEESDHLNLKGMGDALTGASVLPKKYPAEAAELERLGLTDRYLAAAKVGRDQEGKFIHPSQYIKQPDELDAYLGLSQEVPAAAPSSGGGKQAVISNIQKMYVELRGYDTKFKRDPDIRKKYEAALGAVNALLRSVS
tara:strand:+ start:104 stop:553 length:450 start_codon:yes stop_codon:yes gene_type:complete